MVYFDVVCVAGGTDIARGELLAPMLKWLRMGPYWIDTYVIMFICSYFAGSAQLRIHVPKVLDDICAAVPQLLAAEDMADDPMPVPAVPGLNYPGSRQMIMGLYRNMCLLCVQLCTTSARNPPPGRVMESGRTGMQAPFGSELVDKSEDSEVSGETLKEKLYMFPAPVGSRR